jgi:hypothetical protein
MNRQAPAQEVAKNLSSMVAEYRGAIHVVPGFQPRPRRRTAWVDPEAILKREPKKEIKEWMTPKRREACDKRMASARAKKLLRQEWSELDK